MEPRAGLLPLPVHRDGPADRGDHPSTIYVKEAALLPGLDDCLGELFDEEPLDRTCETLAKAAEPDPKTRLDATRSADADLNSTRHTCRPIVCGG
jgi:hypothetical protein